MRNSAEACASSMPIVMTLPTTAPKLHIRALTAGNAAAFLALRLRALLECPRAFGSSHEEESALDLAEVARRLEPGNGGVVLGAFDGTELAGVIGLYRENPLKLRHRVHVWTVYVAPPYRGIGTGGRLLRAVLAHAAGMEGVHRVVLNVEATNAPALALYRAHGFVEVGRDPEALRIDGQFHDEILMSRPVSAGAA
jgi:RimJ/RimL family protein N-acetyltransferase